MGVGLRHNEGIIGLFFAMLAIRGLFIGFYLKKQNNLMPILCVPIIYGMIGLTQGSLISSLLAVVLLPVLKEINVPYYFHKRYINMAKGRY